MLLVSRDDIDKVSLTEYGAGERFIKLPIANYLKLLSFEGKDRRAHV